MKVLLSLSLVVLSIIGLTDAGYITYILSTGQIPPCSAEFQCELVLTSEYSKVFGVPLSALGMFYYTTLLLLAIGHFLEIDPKKIFPFLRSVTMPIRFLDGLLILSTFGFLYSIYLVFLMGAVIGGWCSYCLISAGTSLTIFALTQVFRAQYSEHSSYPIKWFVYTLFAWLYQVAAKPLLFLVNPDKIHHYALHSWGKMASWTPISWLTRYIFAFHDSRLAITVAGIRFPNPIGLSAGYDYNGDLLRVIPNLGFGWHTIGTVTSRAYEGNPPPSYIRLPKSKGLIVNKGLKNDGAAGIARRLAGVQFDIPTGISLSSTNRQYSSVREQLMDFLYSFVIFEKSAVQHSYYELNISCPNVYGGEPFTTPARLELLLTCLDRLALSKPVFVKMPIDQSENDTKALLEVIKKHTIAAVIFGNLTKDRNNPDIEESERALWKSSTGNVSGKATFARSNTLISLARKYLPSEIAVVGTGGIFTAEDALIKENHGAVLFQLITGLIYQGPQLVGQINMELARRTHLLP